MYHSFHHNSAYITMISEGSCDTKDWTNDAENSALHPKDKLHLKYVQTETNSFKCNNFSQYC